MSLSKKPAISRALFFSALLALLFFAPSENARSLDLSDITNGIGAGLGKMAPGPVGSAIKAAVALGKSFQDITSEQEYYLGRAVAANVLAVYTPRDDERLNYYVNTLGQTLARACDRPETFGGYHFLVLDSPEINAFAAPGGLIFVTTGMIRLCKTEDALAAVLAHEISHVVEKHGLKAIKASRLTDAFAVMASEATQNYGPSQLSKLTGAFGESIADITSTMMKSGYSRGQEREADRGAVTILERVGYNPGALAQMLSEMKKQLRPGGLDFAKTHPDPLDRIEDIRPLVSGRPAPAPSAQRQRRFREALSTI
ncbi:MAG: M48 family metallopeptidase [Syntrophobacteraceae bacterium]|nr:M48 family metallopeptidase [Syntrophobacteraceae bacterium]